MPDHEERPPTTLAHGAVKSDDVERVRRDVDKSEERVAEGRRRLPPASSASPIARPSANKMRSLRTRCSPSGQPRQRKRR